MKEFITVYVLARFESSEADLGNDYVAIEQPKWQCFDILM